MYPPFPAALKVGPLTIHWYADAWFFPGTHFDLVHVISAIVILTSAACLALRHRNWPGRRQLSPSPATVEDTQSAGVRINTIQTEG
ncbi:MAG TPA: hypothetical protein VH164_11800 [Ktedonobacteraceae bacterium]|jgi:hypothetical protein|nr:hypothetical protein [Ktedonobacteraceae bacterium]